VKIQHFGKKLSFFRPTNQSHTKILVTTQKKQIYCIAYNKMTCTAQHRQGCHLPDETNHPTFPENFFADYYRHPALLLISVLTMTKSLHPVALDLSCLNSDYETGSRINDFPSLQPDNDIYNNVICR